MDKKNFELYLNKIGEWVVDENKILTYKSLSKNFGVHINTAKQLLHSYWIRQKNDDTLPISATYFVAGKFPDGTVSFTIVNKNDLQITCSEFIEITSKHIYSIQAAKKVKEIKFLYDNNKAERTTESIIKFSKSALKKNRNSRQEDKLFIKNEKNSPKSKNSEAKHNKIPASDVKLESPTEKNDDIVSKNSKKNVEKKCENEKPKEKEKKSKGNIANFFANSTAKNQPSKIAPEIVDVSKDEDKKTKVSPFQAKEKEKNKDKSKFEKSSPKKHTRKEHSDSQKRKRIQVFSDSENSDSCSDIEDVDIEDVEDAEDQVPISNAFEEEEKKTESNCKNKRKKRKIVDVTVMSDDGYLETKKEIVYATDSEEESETQSQSLKSDLKKLKVEDNVKESNVSRGPKKQSSLLTFFKKN